MPVSPFDIHFKTKESRQKLQAEVTEFREQLAARESRPLCEDDLKMIPSEQKISASSAVSHWMEAVQEPRGGNQTPTPVDPVLEAYAAECGILRQRRNERLGPWFTVAGLKPHWFPCLAPITDENLMKETEEIFMRVTSRESNSVSHSVGSAIASGAPLDASTPSASPKHNLNVSGTSSASGSPSRKERSFGEDTSIDQKTVLAPVLVWLLSRTMAELYPGLDDSEAKNFAREDITSATVSLQTFAALLLTLIEPWVYTTEDAVNVLQKIVIESCLAPTYGHMPAAVCTLNSSAFKLPPVLASPSPGRDSRLSQRNNAGGRDSSMSRRSFAATRGTASPPRMFSPPPTFSTTSNTLGNSSFATTNTTTNNRLSGSPGQSNGVSPPLRAQHVPLSGSMGMASSGSSGQLKKKNGATLSNSQRRNSEVGNKKNGVLLPLQKLVKTKEVVVDGQRREK